MDLDKELLEAQRRSAKRRQMEYRRGDRFSLHYGVLLSYEKVCVKCEKKKQLHEFSKSDKMRDGRISWCKECVNAAKRQKTKENPGWDSQRVANYLRRKKNGETDSGTEAGNA